MKTSKLIAMLQVALVMIGCMGRAWTATLYVWQGSPDPKPPYTNWTTAARDIQTAVDAASAGDEVVVTNGVYATGGKAVDANLKNRVAVTKALKLRSVNGPEVTVIEGYQVPGTTNGPGAIRCVYLADGASLSGFTLSKGATLQTWVPALRAGGGVYCAGTDAVVSDCVLTGNSADGLGGGAYGGTLRNCTLTSNSAGDSGGGAYGSTIYNCTLTGNSAGKYGGGADGSTLYNCTLTGNSALQRGGGASGSTLKNCIVYFNTALDAPNYSYCSLNYCCTTPLPGEGAGNIDANPQLVSAEHIAASSPCRGAGNAQYCTGVDIDGEPWASPPSIGCDEVYPGAVTGPLRPTIWAHLTTVGVGYPVNLVGSIRGPTTGSAWDFGDGKRTANQGCVKHAWDSAGDYKVTFTAYNDSHPEGVSATVKIKVVEAMHYVAAKSVNPVPPYSSWATAARTIQDAVDAATMTGATVLVTNGTYATGGRQDSDGRTTRVVVTKPVILKSVAGPESTIISGNGEMRCVYLANGAILSGFTLTKGRSYPDGGGVSAGSWDCVVTNCFITENSAQYGGGASGGTLNNCTLSSNSALQTGGGASGSTLYNCTLSRNSAVWGGGASGSRLYDCTLTGNSARGGGGGANTSTLYNCTLAGNSAGQGGGANSSTLHNCTLSHNSASSGGGAWNSTLYNCTLTGNSAMQTGGGTYYSTLRNCIVYFNTAPDAPNYASGSLNHCCTTPLPAEGVGNIDANPQLASAEHIAASSPCRGAGNAEYCTGVDIDGEPWASPPSIGCDEVYPGAVTGPLSPTIWADLTTVGVGYPVSLVGSIRGLTTASAWDFGDGNCATNQGCVKQAWDSPGDYTVIFTAYNESHPEGVSVTVTIKVVEAVHYVAADSANPIRPYTSWATAARTIQDAVDAATVTGAIVLVTNGTYAAGGGRASDGTRTRVVVTKPVILKSVAGPESTIISGSGEMRCVYLANGAVLSGFTLTKGGTGKGGGVFADSWVCVVTNCFITENSAQYGGGASGGTLYNCTLSGNSASAGGGAQSSTLCNCTLTSNSAWWSGGGASEGTLYNCTLTGNSAEEGGGASGSTLYNCTLTDNSAELIGGGVSGCTLYNCTVTCNSAQSGGGASSSTLNNCLVTGNRASLNGGGVANGVLNNCTVAGNGARERGGGVFSDPPSEWNPLPCAVNNSIVYYNTAVLGENYFQSALNYCCTAPLPAGGVGNIAAEPQLVSLEHIAADSPCRAAGNPQYATGVDIDGEPWASPPSIGCDEVYPAAAVGALTPAISGSVSTVAVGYPVDSTGSIKGFATRSVWDFGDGTRLTNRAFVVHAWTGPGDYAVSFTAYNDDHPEGVIATVTIKVIEAVHYVAADSVNPVPPYSSWATAAKTIQDAVDAANVTGAIVLVTNGTYATGERQDGGGTTNRVVVTKPVIVKSVEGPESTIISGNGEMRCVYLANGAVLSGFTLTKGRAGAGGGVFADSLVCVVTNCFITENYADNGGGASGGTLYNCTLSGNSAGEGGGAQSSTLCNCILTSNSAAWQGGGACFSTLHSCAVTGNSAQYGGGASGGALYNCTVTHNSASIGGGVSRRVCGMCFCIYPCDLGTSIVRNCIVYGNVATNDANYANYGPENDCTCLRLTFCCTTPLPRWGEGNIDVDPQLISAEHIAIGSPCRGVGNPAYCAGVDMDGEPWANPPSIGCDEPHPEAATGPLFPTITSDFTTVGAGYPVKLVGSIRGATTGSAWDFGDGTLASNRGCVDHAWMSPGEYTVTYTAYNNTHPEGVSTTVTIKVVEAVHFVAADSVNPVPPYSSWATAARTIQDAVDVATMTGATVLVTNGTYATGERQDGEGTTNRVVVTKPVIVKSVEGPESTIISGNGEMRCVYLANGAILSGFTLTKGRAGAGGGVFADPWGCVVTNCFITDNCADNGGGASGGTLYNCTLSGNSAVGVGGGAYGCTLHNCTLTGNSAAWGGGGASEGTLYNCTLTDNSAEWEGGGAYDSTLHNCTLSGNSAVGVGGGAHGCTLHNCTLTGNLAYYAGGVSADPYESGAATAKNCIVYFNTPNNYEETMLDYCCTTPLPAEGIGNIDADPRFVNAKAGDFRLLPDSPCIDAGTDLSGFISTDIAGVPRPLDGNGDGIARFDIGAYEFNPYRFLTLVFDQFGFRFTVQGEPGKRVRLERSRDLINWETAAIVPLPASGQTLIDPAGIMEPYLFYRAVLVP